MLATEIQAMHFILFSGFIFFNIKLFYFESSFIIMEFFHGLSKSMSLIPSLSASPDVPTITLIKIHRRFLKMCATIDGLCLSSMPAGLLLYLSSPSRETSYCHIACYSLFLTLENYDNFSIEHFNCNLVLCDIWYEIGTSKTFILNMSIRLEVQLFWKPDEGIKQIWDLRDINKNN